MSSICPQGPTHRDKNIAETVDVRLRTYLKLGQASPYVQGFIQRGALGFPPPYIMFPPSSIFQMLLCNNIKNLGALD